MTPDTVSSLIQALDQLRLLSPEQRDVCARDLEPRCSDPHDLARGLVQRGWLTAYQVNELFLGHGEGLLLGSYVLLDRLGEGGMGTVFKARNWKLDTLVALKVIKKDRLARPDTIKRFYREIRAVAQLDHPNIVRAYDADEVEGTHYFVMEYVEGTDLNQLVKSHGPLGFAEACEYVRQVALGLQHAFERGLVHRDIKPHNLLLNRLGVVKLLDMGLALIETPANDEHSGTMTHSGVVMGTPDYMAPEQSMDAHGVDIRADLYSLGCTLHFLLTGRAPFAGGTLTQKLMRHQNDMPEPLRKSRPEVPEELELLVRKLLAKRPEERYQTPRELASALETIHPSLAASSVTASRTAVEDAPSKTEVVVRRGWAEIVPAPAPGERPAAPLSRLVVPISAAILVLLALAGGIWWATRPGKKPETPSVVEGPPRSKSPDKVQPPRGQTRLPTGPATNEWVEAVRKLPPAKQAEAVFAKLGELNGGFQARAESNTFEEADGEVTRLEMRQPLTNISPLRALKRLKWLELPSPGGRVPTIVSVEDISPLGGLPLERLNLSGHRVEDLSPLADMPLTNLAFDFNPYRDAEWLRKMRGLTKINNLPAEEFWRKEDTRQAAFQKWCDDVARLPAKEQAQEVANELVKRNPDFDGKFEFKPAAGGKGVREFRFSSEKVEDLAPVRALAGLQELYCPGHHGTAGSPLANLWPLKGLPLKKLDCSHSRVADLYALADSSLTVLQVSGNQVRDLAPLRNLPLESLNIFHQPVRDLSPLKGMKLKILQLSDTRVSDLTPLVSMPLEVLALNQSDVVDIAPLKGMRLLALTLPAGVSDLTPIRDMPLTELALNSKTVDLAPVAALKEMKILRIEFVPWRHSALARSLPKLERVRGAKGDILRPELCAWADWEDAVRAASPDKQIEMIQNKFNELHPGAKIKVRRLEENDGRKGITLFADEVTDLSPARALPGITFLHCVGSQPGVSKLRDLGPLSGLPLTDLSLSNTEIGDLSPLRNMPLRFLNIERTKVTDLSPLKEIRTLTTINGKPAAEILK